MHKSSHKRTHICAKKSEQGSKSIHLFLQPCKTAQMDMLNVILRSYELSFKDKPRSTIVRTDKLILVYGTQHF